MKMDQMTIAQVQKHMSKVLAKQNLSPWSVDDEIMTAQFNTLPASKSRNQREGYFNGWTDGRARLRTSIKCTPISISHARTRKQRKLNAIRNKESLNKILMANAWVN